MSSAILVNGAVGVDTEEFKQFSGGLDFLEV
jgi:hypothetical protein